MNDNLCLINKKKIGKELHKKCKISNIKTMSGICDEHQRIVLSRQEYKVIKKAQLSF